MTIAEKMDLLEEVNDVKGKLEDIIETLNLGKELDSTQEAFLRLHNIVE